MTNTTFSSKKAQNNARVRNLMENLRRKLKNFAVMDRQGQRVGEVKDLILDANRQLNLVVFKLANQQSDRLILLMSKLIQKIEPTSKAIFVDMNKSEIEHMPEYEPQGREISHNGTLPTETTTPTTMPVAVETTSQDMGIDSMTPDITDMTDIAEEEIIRLLGERLIVDSHKRKAGEVIVRKQIETRMVQVPVRYEKLIVEQVSPDHKQLAEIDLGQGEITGIELNDAESSESSIFDTGLTGGRTVSGVFDSPKVASLLLNAIALERNPGCKAVRVQIIVENAEQQQQYQEWFNRCSRDE